jgi:large subunit ribosomal protein L11
VEINMAKKEITKVFKVQAPGGKATPAPPLGPILGGAGVNPGQFIQKFNAETAKFNGKIVVAVVTAYSDRTFTFELKSSPAAELIKEAAKIEKGAGVPNKEKVGKVTRAQVKKIAEEKFADLGAATIEGAMRTIEGTCRQMGVTVVEG